MEVPTALKPRQEIVTSWAPMKRQREAMHITQAALARTIGVHRMTIYRIEKGAHAPSIDIAFAICRALGVPLAQLIEIREA